MGLEIIIQSEESEQSVFPQKEEDKYHVISLIRGI